MANDDFRTTPDDPLTRDSFLRYSNDYSNANKAYKPPNSFLFNDDESLTETDLLPDDESYREPGYEPGTKRSYEYDVAVIGGGPAGYTAAIRASQVGAEVILFEREMLGGLCLSAGCVPSKAYLKAAEILNTVNSAQFYGISGGDNAVVDLQRTLLYKNNIISKLTSNIARQLRACGVRVEAGEARLQSAHEIHCRGRNYTASKVILCGGTRPGYPDITGLSHPGVCTPNDVFRMAEVPARMLILGGGSAGCEIASTFAAFGSNVMLVEPHTRILPDMDAQVAEAIENALTGAGVKVHAGIGVREIADRDGYPFIITERGGVLCDKVVITTERRTDTSFLGSLTNAIAFRNDVVLVNEYLETSVPGIFAAGDITGLCPKTHAAYTMAECAVTNALGGKKPLDLNAIPLVVHTIPQAASVGLSEGRARDQYGGELLIGYCALADNTRAMLTGVRDGFVKVLAGKRYGEIYGVHIVGADAAEMIAEPAALIRMEVTLYEAASDIVHAHPSFSEAFTAACADALNRSIHHLRTE